MEWRARPASRSESAVLSRRVHRLADRAFIRFGAGFARVRFTHLMLTASGRQVAAELLELLGPHGEAYAEPSDLPTR